MLRLLRAIETKLYRWLKTRRDTRILKGQAKLILEPDSEATERARLHAAIMLDAIKNRRPICRDCMNPYDPHERTQGERFRLRNILMVPDREPDPMLCDNCYERSVSTFNPQATNVGTSNSGPPNMVLQEKYRRTNHG